MSVLTEVSAHGLCFGAVRRLLVRIIKDDSDAIMGPNVQNEPMRAVEVHVANLGHATNS